MTGEIMNPEPIPGNDGADNVHHAEQLWAEASERVDAIVEYGRKTLPEMYANASGNTDISVVYDWWKAYIQSAENVGEAIARVAGLQRNGAHDMTILMCAAAITKLMFSQEDMAVSTVLTAMEKEIINDDDR